MRGRGLVWPSIRWRLGSSIVFFLVATAAVVAATTGPIYLTAAYQSAEDATLLAAPVYSGGMTISPAPGVTSATAANLAKAASAIPGGAGTSSKDLYEPSIVSFDFNVGFPDRRTQLSVEADLASRTGVCGQVRFVAGHCATSDDELLMSTRSLAYLGLKVGDRVRSLGMGSFTVAGAYAATGASNPYWWGTNPFPFGTSFGHSILIDDVFISQGEAQRLSTTQKYGIMAQLPLRASAVRATTIASLDSEIASYETSVQSLHLVASSGLPGLLQGVQQQESQIRTIVAAVALELALLALLVLYQVAASNSAARAPDLEIAELRGLPRRLVASMALREPVLLLAVSVPVGVLLSWLLVALLSASLLGAGTQSIIGGLALAAAIATFVGGAIAAVLGSLSLVFPSIARESRVDVERRSRRNSLIIDLLALALAVAALVELLGAGSATSSGGSRIDPLASLTPGAVALIGGILAARFLPWLARAGARATRWSPKVALALASRSLMRRRGVARRVVVLVIAIGLLAFSTAGYSLAAANRRTQAGFEIGAPYVLSVNVATGVNFETAVEQADPSGHEAMAVAKIEGNSPTLAVDSSRFEAIANWPPGTFLSTTALSTILHFLRPATAPPVTIERAVALRMRVRLPARVVPPPQLVLNLFDEQSDTNATLNFGSPLHKGTNEVDTSLDTACSLVCRVNSIALYWTPPNGSNLQEATIPLDISDAEARQSGAWKPANLGLSKPGVWAPQIANSVSAEATAATTGSLGASTAGSGTSSVSVRVSEGVLAAVFRAGASATAPAIAPADLPTIIPAVLTAQLADLDANPATPNRYTITGLDGATLNALSPVLAEALPQIGSNGALMDLGLAQAAMDGTLTDVHYQVWCKASPSAGLLQRLGARGISVTGMQTEAGILHTSDKSAPALAFDLFVLAGIGAGILALGALWFSIASDSRRRAVEVAALVAAGVPKRLLRRSLFIEQVAIVLASCAVGLGAGLVAGRLSLRLLPEFPAGRQGPSLPTGVGVGVPEAVLACAVACVLLLAGGILASWLTIRRARPELMRSSA